MLNNVFKVCSVYQYICKRTYFSLLVIHDCVVQADNPEDLGDSWAHPSYTCPDTPRDVHPCALNPSLRDAAESKCSIFNDTGLNDYSPCAILSMSWFITVNFLYACLMSFIMSCLNLS